MPERVPMPKTAAFCGGGGGYVTSPAPGGLTWSDYFALNERAALLPCKPRPLGLGEIDEAGKPTFNVNTNGGHSLYFRQCRQVQ